jgi:hypothetical protein
MHPIPLHCSTLIRKTLTVYETHQSELFVSYHIRTMLPLRGSGQESANSAGASTSSKRSHTDTFKVPKDAVWQHFETKDKDRSNNFLAV